MKWFKEPERRAKLNDDPESVYGTLFGKVRAIDPDGKIKWYPAIYSSKEFKGGHGEDVAIRMTYGDPKNPIWKALPDGTFKPFFRDKQQDLDAKKQGTNRRMIR